MRKFGVVLLFLFTAFLSIGQQHLFPLDHVRLRKGVFAQAQQTDLRYILQLEPDRLLAPYLIDAKLPPKAERYGNWESSGLDGHIGGHYLTALAWMYAATGEPEMKRRLDYMVSELERCQKANGNGYVGGIPQGKVFWERIRKGDIDGSSFGLNNTWVPLYNIHKLFAGLYDAWQLGKNTKARDVLVGLADWMISLTSGLSDDQIEQVLKTEHGAIHESFLDLYIGTQDPKYLEAAVRFTHKAFLGPMLARQDMLTGLHANTQIPKMTGVERIAQVKNQKDWSDAAEYFWENVAHHRSVAFGGNSYREHFHELDRFDKMLETNQGPETCNSYNMLKLSKALFLRTDEEKYLEFYEKTVFNHILSSQHPEKGGFVYFTPIRPQHYRVYSQPETSMWCCVGTGLENHTKYGELIYTKHENDLRVNLMIASELVTNDEHLELRTAFPYQNEVEVVVHKWGAANLSFRVPSWMHAPKFTLNGQEVLVKRKGNYAVINRKWQPGEVLKVTFTMAVSQVFLPHTTTWSAFQYGPIVLASETGKEDLVGLFADDSRMGHETRGKMYPLSVGHVFLSETPDITARVKKGVGLTFQVDTLQLRPFFEIHESRYQMYFQILNQNAYRDFQQAKAREEEFERSIVDQIRMGEQQPEADHGYSGLQSRSGYDHGSFWRSTSGYMAYEMRAKGGKSLVLYGLEPLQNIKIEINGQAVSYRLDDPKTATIALSEEDNIRIKIYPQESGKPTSRLTQLIIIQD